MVFLINFQNILQSVLLDNNVTSIVLYSRFDINFPGLTDRYSGRLLEYIGEHQFDTSNLRMVGEGEAV